MSDPSSIRREDIVEAFAKLGIDLTHAVHVSFGAYPNNHLNVTRHYLDERGSRVSAYIPNDGRSVLEQQHAIPVTDDRQSADG